MAAATLTGAAWAATPVWNVQLTGGPHDYNNPANWNAGAGPVPTDGDTAAINANYTGALTLDVTAASGLNTLTLGDSAPTASFGTDYVPVTIGGAQLTFQNAGAVAAAGTINSSNGANTVNNALAMSQAGGVTGLTINANGGTLTLNGDVSGAANVIVGGSAGAFYFGTFTPNPGVAVLNGAKSFTGNLTVNAGAAVQANSSAALGAAAGPGHVTATGAVYLNYAGAGADLATKINTASTGAVGITAASAGSAFDFASHGSLALGSGVTGTAASGGVTYTGALTPNGAGYRFGGGGAATKLILGAGTLTGAAGATVAGSGITQMGNAAAGYSGALAATGGTLYVPNGVSLQAAASLTTSGTGPTTAAAVLLDPTQAYTGPGVTLDNGAIGWTGNKSITALPGAYSANTIAGPGDYNVANAKLLNLGGVHSSGTMTLGGGFAIADDGGTPVALVKSGYNSTLDLTTAPAGGNGFTGGMYVAGGTVLFNNANQLGAGASGSGQNRIVIDSGILKLAPGSGTVVLNRNVGVRGGGPFLDGRPNTAAIDVSAGDTLRITSALGSANNGGIATREGLRKAGAGTLEILPSAIDYTTSSIINHSYYVNEGTLRTNFMPYRNQAGAATGFLVFTGTSTFDVQALPVGTSVPSSNYNGGYGFQDVVVMPGVTGTISVAAGGRFKTDGRSNGGLNMVGSGGTLVMSGADDTALFQFGPWQSSGSTETGTSPGGTVDLRGGTVSAPGFNANNFAVFPRDATFTMKLNGGVWDVTNFAGSHTGHLVVNDLSAAGTPRIGVSVATASTSGTSGAYAIAGTGNTSWRGTLEKTGVGNLRVNRTGGTVTVAAGSTLKISAGQILAGGAADPFTDNSGTATNGTSVAVLNDATFSVTDGAKQVASVLNSAPTAGTLNVSGTGVLSARKVVQNTINIGAGTRLNLTGGVATNGAGNYDDSTANTLAVNGTLDIGRSGIAVPNSSLSYAAAAAMITGGQLVSSGVQAQPASRQVGVVDNGTVTTARYTTQGDTNLDGQFNIFDVFAINGAGKFGQGPDTAVWAEGDVNYDAEFNISDVFAINGAGQFGAGPVTDQADNTLVGVLDVPAGSDGDGKITLIYDAATGDLKIDTDGVGVGGINLSSIGSAFKNGAVGTSPIFYQANAGGTTLGFGALAGSIADGTILPGVFDPGLTESFLLSDLTVTGVTSGPAANQVTFAVVAVPEPAALGLLGALALGLCRRSTRRGERAGR
ncbi:MAG TPA: hypothetical protein VEA69_17630 [Tepidisphaeraceae bacterium]|nr:hypothetical protein [Tepidisphaeraceae bacterium]